MSTSKAITMVQRSAPALQRLGCWDTDKVTELLRVCLGENPYLARIANTDEGGRSLCVAVARAIGLGLDPSGGPLGSAYLVPFKNTITLIPGYRGLVSIAQRDGHMANVHAEIAYAQDEFDLLLGTERGIVHRPSFTAPRRLYADGGIKLPDDNPATVVYCTWVDPATRDAQFHWMPIADVLRTRDRSRGFQGTAKASPWRDWPEEMAKKTVLKSAMKLLPLSAGLGSSKLAEALRRASVEDTGDIPPEDAEIIDIPGAADSTDQTRQQDTLAEELGNNSALDDILTRLDMAESPAQIDALVRQGEGLSPGARRQIEDAASQAADRLSQ